MSSLKANTITDRVGTGAPNFPNGLTVNRGSLGTTAGNTLTVSDFYHNNGNVSYFRIKATRSTSGSDWTTASTKLLQVIDVTEMGYVEFNPNGSNFGIALGQGASEHMRLLSNGNIGIGLTNPTQKLDVNGNLNVSGSITATNINTTN